jgi:hypothetical protein
VAKQSAEFRRYAVIGAEQRLLEISAEAASIYRSFPELRRRGQRTGTSVLGQTTDGRRKGAVPGRRRRRRMSAEARKRISDAQKARWARQKAQGGGGVKKK